MANTNGSKELRIYLANSNTKISIITKTDFV